MKVFYREEGELLDQSNGSAFAFRQNRPCEYFASKIFNKELFFKVPLFPMTHHPSATLLGGCNPQDPRLLLACYLDSNSSDRQIRDHSIKRYERFEFTSIYNAKISGLLVLSFFFVL